jgi:hypothetical protein
VQPAQLSLLPDQVRTPPPIVLGALQEEGVAEAISLLGALIAKSSGIATTTTTHEDDDE